MHVGVGIGKSTKVQLYTKKYRILKHINGSAPPHPPQLAMGL